MSNVKYYGTHNSGTSSSLVWWLRPFGYILNMTSRCQSRDIHSQLSDGVRLFNFQVCYYNNEWHFSHGLCIYDGLLLDWLRVIKEYLSKNVDEVIYIQVSLDKNFLVGQDVDKFNELLYLLQSEYVNERLVLLWCVIEGGDFIYRNKDIIIDYQECYWVSGMSNKFIDKFPLPKYYAKRNNDKYRSESKSKILMLDYYEL